MNDKMQNQFVNNDAICSNNKSEKQQVEFSENKKNLKRKYITDAIGLAEITLHNPMIM